MLNRLKSLRSLSYFVPRHEPPDISDLKNFKEFLNNYNNILVLTGAGVSTESGIPDYRSEGVGLFSRTSFKPIQYLDFVKNPDARSRYWARNFVGWNKFRFFEPNSVHLFLAKLELLNKISGVITQNVDGLHSKAGSRNILELHGNAFWVRCIQCGDTMLRSQFQTILENCNPFVEASPVAIRPDGDVELKEEDVKNFIVPSCEKCGGILKPTVVFFGENIPRKVVEKAENMVEKCDAMLILGTSLSTLSSSRLVEQACDLCKYLFLINIGVTRCDKIIDSKISANVSDVIFDIV